MRTLPKLVLLALLTVYVVWGSTYLAIRYALVSFPPFLQMGTRFLAAGALLYLYQKWRGAPNPTPRQWRDGAVVGILLLAGGTGVVAYAEQTVSSSLTAVFTAASPLMFALWSGWFGKWPNRTEWLGIATGFSGVALLASGAGLAGQPQGIMALCVASTCWSFGSILSQRRLAVAPGAIGVASEMLAGGAFLLIVAWLRGETVVLPLDTKAVIAWLYLVTIGSMLAFSAYMYVLSKLPPTMASSYAYVNPVIAVALGVGLAGEALSLHELVAMMIILGSVVLMTRAKVAPAKERI